MRIAVINETSAAGRNPELLAALDGRGHEIINAGMTQSGTQPELMYTHTGLMSAILLDLKIVDFVVGGCGTGQGFLSSVMQYPGIFCGHILSPLDAWLFARINAGNCVSLALNQGYGWAGEINLRMIFDALLSELPGSGFPEHRREPQRRSREILAGVSLAAHRSMPEILARLPEEVTRPALSYPGFMGLIRPAIEREEYTLYREALKMIGQVEG
jgi:ribose 5-phosphate isomerase RpiB